MEKVTHNEEETEAFAAELARRVPAGTFISLSGDLGAGKTAFVRGFAKGMGAQERVLSPSFQMERVYLSGRLPLFHFDVYRLSDISQLEETGYFDRIEDDNAIVLCEWAELLGDWLPPKNRRIDIMICVSSDTEREITVEGIEEPGGPV